MTSDARESEEELAAEGRENSGERLLLEISDDGQGIDPELLTPVHFDALLEAIATLHG